MLDQKTLDEIWDADDAAQSEARVRVELDEGGPYDEIERAELKTQLARALGLQEKYGEAADILIEIEAEDAPVVVTRILLESGRIVHSAGDPVGAANLFQQAAEIADIAVRAHAPCANALRGHVAAVEDRRCGDPGRRDKRRQ